MNPHKLINALYSDLDNAADDTSANQIHEMIVFVERNKESIRKLLVFIQDNSRFLNQEPAPKNN